MSGQRFGRLSSGGDPLVDGLEAFCFGAFSASHHECRTRGLGKGDPAARAAEAFQVARSVA